MAGTAAHRHRVLIVEDDDILGRALAKMIQREADAVLVDSIARAKRSVRESEPDALILDVGLPDGDGLDFLAWARERGVHAPALVITGRYEPKLANRADLLKAQFAFKPEILPNVKAFLRRVQTTASAAETTHRAVVVALELAGRVGMTPREIDVVRLVAQRVPRGELASRLNLSENTLKTWIRSLLAKAKLPNLDALVRVVLEGVARDAVTQSSEYETVELPLPDTRRGGSGA